MSGLISDITDLGELDNFISLVDSEMRILSHRRGKLVIRKKELLYKNLKEGGIYFSGNTFFKISKIKNGFAGGLTIEYDSTEEEFTSLCTFSSDLSILGALTDASQEQAKAVDNYIRTVLGIKSQGLSV